MEPHVVAGRSPRDEIDPTMVSTEGVCAQLSSVESYLLQALERLDAADSKVQQLEAALQSSRDIGAAVGVVMALRRLTREQAFDALRHASMARNVKLRALALDVLETGSLDGSTDERR